MPRLNLLLTEIYFNQLQENAAKQGISLARYARNLIDIGLQVETTTMQSIESNAKPNDKKNNITPHEGETNELWKNSLLCALESRYLIRYLVDNLPNQSDEKREAVIEAVKEKARALVVEWLPD